MTRMDHDDFGAHHSAASLKGLFTRLPSCVNSTHFNPPGGFIGLVPGDSPLPSVFFGGMIPYDQLNECNPFS